MILLSNIGGLVSKIVIVVTPILRLSTKGNFIVSIFLFSIVRVFAIALRKKMFKVWFLVIMINLAVCFYYGKYHHWSNQLHKEKHYNWVAIVNLLCLQCPAPFGVSVMTQWWNVMVVRPTKLPPWVQTEVVMRTSWAGSSESSWPWFSRVRFALLLLEFCWIDRVSK